MNDIDQLLQAYKTLTNTVAKSQTINEKIFKEMIVSKIRKSFMGIKLFDIMGWLLCITCFPYLIYWSYISRHKTDVFIMSLISLVLFFSFVLYSYKQYKWKFSIQLFVEHDMKATLLSMKEASILLKQQRRIGMYFMIPMTILALPVSWYGKLNLYYIDVLKWHWEHSMWYLIYIVFALGLSIYIAWKLYDWMYFNTFKKIEKNIEQLEE